MNPIISVIVPIYKVEKYLDQCIASIVNQTYRNLEIILVDDGSPDNCPAMCDAWAQKDSRIKVIHKENGGLSDARNAGMVAASGTLIGFVDSDDWIAPDMYQLLYADMLKNGSDISACGVQMVWDDAAPPKMLTPSGSRVMDRAGAMKELIRERAFKQPVWYKLYKTSQICDIQFPVGKYHEDVFWSYQAFARANRVSVFDTPCYFYRQRGGSIMAAGFAVSRLDGLEAKTLRQEYLERNMPGIATEAKWDLFFSGVWMMQQTLLHLSGEEREAARKKINEMIKTHKPGIKELRVLSWKEKVWGMIGQISFEGLCRLKNAMKRGI